MATLNDVVVNNTTVIDTSGQVDWGRLKNVPNLSSSDVKAGRSDYNSWYNSGSFTFSPSNITGASASWNHSCVAAIKGYYDWNTRTYSTQTKGTTFDLSGSANSYTVTYSSHDNYRGSSRAKVTVFCVSWG